MLISKKIYKMGGLTNVDVLVNGVAVKTFIDELGLKYSPFRVETTVIKAEDRANRLVAELELAYHNIIYL